MCCFAEARFQARNLRQRGVDQTLGLDNVKPRGCTGLKLQLGQIQRFAAGRKVLASDRQTLLIITHVDISCGDCGDQRQTLNIDRRVSRIERRVGAFLGPLVTTEKIEKPGDAQAAGGCVRDRHVTVASLCLACGVLSLRCQARQRARAGRDHLGFRLVDAFDRLHHGEVLREARGNVTIEAAVVECIPPRDGADVAVTGFSGFRKLARQLNFRGFVVGPDNTA
ncbi:hypothetical protein D3C86_1063430 [compost metagenome]